MLEKCSLDKLSSQKWVLRCWAQHSFLVALGASPLLASRTNTLITTKWWNILYKYLILTVIQYNSSTCRKAFLSCILRNRGCVRVGLAEMQLNSGWHTNNGTDFRRFCICFMCRRWRSLNIHWASYYVYILAAAFIVVATIFFVCFSAPRSETVADAVVDVFLCECAVFRLLNTVYK